MNNDVIYQANDNVPKDKAEKKLSTFPKLSHLPAFILNWIDQNSHDMIGLWNMQKEMLFVTKSVETILGYQSDDLLGTQWKKLVLKEDRYNFYKQINDNNETNNFHITIMNHTKKPLEFTITLDKISDESSENTYYIGLFRKNITENKTKEMIIQSEKMSVAGQLAAGIAHEIRNPLTSLKGFLQLLQTDVKQKEVYHQIMIEEIDKIEMITSELLYISKPLTDEKKLESVYSMIKDVTILLGSQAHLKNIQLEHSVCEEFYIYCNRSQIKQVFINIIKNAIESMEKSGVITIEVRLTSHKMIEIDILDQGPGIPQDMIKKIGEPFFTTKESGTGLGLMISKQILENQHGRLRIVKSNENGSTFRITFPEP